MCGLHERSDFLTDSTLGGCGSLEKTDFYQFLLWKGLVVLKELIFYSVSLGSCGVLERTVFQQFLLWRCLVVLKEQSFNNFYLWRVVWS